MILWTQKIFIKKLTNGAISRCSRVYVEEAAGAAISSANRCRNGFDYLQ